MNTLLKQTQVLKISLELDEDGEPIVEEIFGSCSASDIAAVEDELIDGCLGTFLTDEQEKTLRKEGRILIEGRLKWWEISSLNFGIDHEMSFEPL